MSQAGSFQFNRMDCKDESTSLESYDDSNYNNSNSSSISGNSSPSNDSKEKEKARVTQTSLVLWHARQNDSKALKKLLDQDPSLVQARDYDERTALHVAALHGCVEAAKCLLEHGASVNAQDRWQNSPLADAEGANQQDMVELLKMNGGKHLGNHGSRLEAKAVSPPLPQKCDWEIDPSELDLLNCSLIGKLAHLVKPDFACMPCVFPNFFTSISKADCSVKDTTHLIDGMIPLGKYYPLWYMGISGILERRASIS
eukprot:Gb_36893 [translate_table: standard]